MSHEEHVAAEPDNPKVLLIVVVTLATIMLFVGIVIGVNAFWEQTVTEQVEAKVSGATDARFKALRAEEKDKLTNYAWMDKKAGVARIPLDRAVDLTLRDWKSQHETPAAPAPAPAPATPTAPAGKPAPAPVAPTAPAGKPVPAPTPKH